MILVACGLIGGILSVDFFGVEGFSKFYREASLQVMGWTSAFAVIVLSARQLPREMENRTIYPLLARPVRRVDFLFGKLLGVILAGFLCFILFMLIFAIGSMHLSVSIPWGLFFQHVYLQILMLSVLATMAFLLSLLMHKDAAMTICTLLFLVSSFSTNLLVQLYEYMGSAGRGVLILLTYAIPQLTLFDLSEKAVHAEIWSPLSWQVIFYLTIYAICYTLVFFAGALLLFRRRAI